MTVLFNGARLKLMRGFHGFSQRELAERLEVTQQAIAFIEGQRKQPSEVLLRAISEVCGVEEEFFYQGTFEDFREEECHFRRRASTAVSLRTRALSAGTLFNMFATWLEEQVELPEHRISAARILSPEDIERAAEHHRMAWGLGLDTPIANMVRVLESLAGVLTTRINLDAEKIDAFSRQGVRSVVVMTERKSGSRQQFDCAHELGHLVMHGGVETGDVETEGQANRFASAFLLPRAGFMRDFQRTDYIDWSTIFRLKATWRVSAAAILRRAYDLRLVDAVTYQRACKTLAMKGWHRGEPEDWSTAEPELVRIALAQVKASKGLDVDDVCRHLHWHPSTFFRVTEIEVREESAQLAEVISLARWRA